MGATDEVTHYVTASDGIELAVYKSGRVGAPVILFVHGYPDTHAIWDGVAADLADDFRIVTYDVRGAGLSEIPLEVRSYRIGQLVDDLGRVINAVSPEAPVHVVAHDWGSIQSWDALPDDRLGVRIRTFTSISGPSLDHVGLWARALYRGPVRRLRQALGSWYVGFFLTPFLPEIAARHGLVNRVVDHSSSLAGHQEVAPEDSLEREVDEALNGIALYRANMPSRLLRPRPPRVTLPVLVITPSHDIHVSAAMAAEAPRGWAANLTVKRIHGNHWVIAQRPTAVAAMVRDFVDEWTPDRREAADESDFPR